MISCHTLHGDGFTLLNWDELAEHPQLEAIVDDVYATCQDPAMQRFTTIPTPYTRQMAHSFVQQPAHRWAIMVQGRYCGNIEVRTDNDPMDIGYSLAPWARGQGLMIRACELAVAAIFDQGVTRLAIDTVAENHASQAVATRLGAQLVQQTPNLRYYLEPSHMRSQERAK